MIISNALRKSAGHNPQKVIHAAQPSELPKGRAAKQCACGLWFSLPSCHAPRHKSCSAKCSARQRAEIHANQQIRCQQCDAVFRPRPNQLAKGQGRFCSIPCGLISTRKSVAFLESRARAAVTRRNSSYVPKAGPAHPRWKGGPEAYRQRRTESGDAAKQLREYRSANPHKTREWAQNRKNRRAGRLEYGTLPRLMQAQRGKCANCRCCIRSSYHVDHITPLARGGRHEAGNIQLLCGSCNLRKSDRDPIQFAQLNGRLL